MTISTPQSHIKERYRSRRKTSGGTRPDLGVYVRSKWEANIYRYLRWLQENGEIKRFDYESEEFEFPVKRGTKFYKVDFKITNKDDTVEYWELKGYMDPESATAIRRMRQYYPHVNLKLIQEKEYYAIHHKVKWLIPNWE